PATGRRPDPEPGRGQAALPPFAGERHGHRLRRGVGRHRPHLPDPRPHRGREGAGRAARAPLPGRLTRAMTLLDGLRVLDVSLLAPNMLGMHLADLGADVIKVEDPARPDYTRHVGAARLNGVSFLQLRWN